MQREKPTFFKISIKRRAELSVCFVLLQQWDCELRTGTLKGHGRTFESHSTCSKSEARYRRIMHYWRLGKTILAVSAITTLLPCWRHSIDFPNPVGLSGQFDLIIKLIFAILIWKWADQSFQHNICCVSSFDLFKCASRQGYIGTKILFSHRNRNCLKTKEKRWFHYLALQLRFCSKCIETLKA